MKITIATTWNSACGISEYSQSLANSFIKLGHEIAILGSEVFPLYKEDEPFVTRMGSPGKTDILHLQYSSFIFKREYYDAILHEAKKHGAKCFATFHDQHLYPGIDYVSLNAAIAHRDDIFNHLPAYLPKYVLQSGVPATKVRIASYGLGRNKEEDIKTVCSELDYDFIVSDWRSWKTQAELLEFIKSGDGVILWYPENKGAGSSSAARFAIGARRPLFLNKCEWFKELEDIPNVTFFTNYAGLKKSLQEYYANWYIERHNWDEIAKQHLEIYSK